MLRALNGAAFTACIVFTLCFLVLLVETGSPAWRYYSSQHKTYIVHVTALIYKDKLISCVSDVYIILMHTFILVWCNTLHFSIKYKQGTSFFEKVFTVIFNNEVSSVKGKTWHLQSECNTEIGSLSLVRFHGCNQRGTWCKASASGLNSKDKSTGKWELPRNNSWAKHCLQHKRIWLALRDSHTLLHCLYCTQYVTIGPLVRFVWRILLTFLIDIQT